MITINHSLFKAELYESHVDIEFAKMPMKMWHDLEYLALYAYNLFSSEIVALIYYDNNKIWTWDVPEQKVSSVSVDYKANSCSGTFHSHPNMSAFDSSVDVEDMKTCPGLHITYGFSPNELISKNCSIKLVVTPDIICELSFTDIISVSNTNYVQPDFLSNFENYLKSKVKNITSEIKCESQSLD